MDRTHPGIPRVKSQLWQQGLILREVPKHLVTGNLLTARINGAVMVAAGEGLPPSSSGSPGTKGELFKWEVYSLAGQPLHDSTPLALSF